MKTDHTRAPTRFSLRAGAGVENVSTTITGRASDAENRKQPSPERETTSRRAGRTASRTFGPSEADRTRLPALPARTPGQSDGSRAKALPGLPPTVTIHPAGRNRPGIEIRVRDALIAAAAHELWKQRGGNEVLNWLEAEMLVDDALRRLPG